MKNNKINLIVNPKSFENEDYNKGKVTQIDDELEFLRDLTDRNWTMDVGTRTRIDKRIEHLTNKRKELSQ